MVDASSIQVSGGASSAATATSLDIPPPFASILPSDDERKEMHSRIDSAVGFGSPDRAPSSAWDAGSLHKQGKEREHHHQPLLRLENADDEPEINKETTPDLVKHFIEFFRVLEDRMTRLEHRPSKRLPEDHGSSNCQTLAEPSGSQDATETVFAPLSRRLTETDTKAAEIIRELCPADDCSDNHILRVGCHNLASSSAINSTSTAPGGPDPNQIEMIFISIRSPAISRFLEAQTGFRFDSDGLIHVTRPFKVLIQNAAAMKDQIRKLETKYGLVSHYEAG